jgi:TolB-like protein
MGRTVGSGTAEEMSHKFAGFSLDRERGLLRDGKVDVQLRAKSLELLLHLVSNAGRVVSKSELLDAVWNGLAISEDSLTQCIHDVRRALGDSEQKLVRTVPRRGYLFPAEMLEAPKIGQPNNEEVAGPIPGRPSLAVLPFLNLSGDPDQDYFADGMAEEIITALTRIKWLVVISRNSSFAYKGRAVDVKIVSHELGVRYLLEGSVRKASGRIRVSAHLVDADTGVQLWAERFDGTVEDIFELQDQITSRVVGAIAPKLESAEIDRAGRKATANLQAYDYYLRSLSGFYRITRPGNDEALFNLYRAIDLDPSFATAYGLAARVLVQRNSGGWIDDFEREFGEAEKLARRAVELGQDDAVALSCAAFALCDLCGDPKSAVICVDQALGLSPSLASAWLYSSWIRCAIADVKIALEHIQCVRRLSPNDPQAFSIHCCEGIVHFTAGNYRQALTSAEAAMQVKFDHILANCLAVTSAIHAGLADEAAAALRRVLRFNPSLSISRVSRIQPFYDKEVERVWFKGLREAGLPE